MRCARPRPARAARAGARDRRACRAVLREVVPGPGADRVLAPELAAAEDLVASGAIWRAAAEGGAALA